MTQETDEAEKAWNRLMEEFGYTCPECDAPEGMCGTVSCSECGHIPDEHAWTSATVDRSSNRT